MVIANKMRLCFIALILRFIFTVRAENCSPAYCNYEGECSGPIGNPTCKCLKNYFKGPKCAEKYVHCENNPCPTGKKCMDHFGGYFCACKNESRIGDNCDIAIPQGNGVLFNPRIIYSRVTYLNEIVPILFVMRNKISFNCSIEISWKFGPVASINIVDGETSPLTYVSDVQNLVKMYKISKAEQIAKSSGFYYRTSIQPSSTGIHNIKLLVLHEGTLLHSMDYEILVWVSPFRKARAAGCTPKSEFLDCSKTASSPKLIPITQWELIKTKTTRSCGIDSVVTYTWSAEDADNAGAKKTPFKDKVLNLELKPFALPGLETKWKLTVRVDEKSKDGSKKGSTVDSCFLQYRTEPPVVLLDGPQEMTIHKLKPTKIIFKRSFDPMDPKKGRATLKFSWSCKVSTSAVLKYCKEKMEMTDHTLAIPSDSLFLGKYEYTIKVTATNRKDSFAYGKKILYVGDKPVPMLYIYCITNCGHGKTVPSETVHLKGSCGTVTPYAPPSMVWSVTGKEWEATASDMETTFTEKKLIIKAGVLKEGEKYLVRLNCTFPNVATAGLATMDIIVNEPPKGGRCEIEPNTGDMSSTTFAILCFGYNQPSDLIKVKVYQNTGSIEMLLISGLQNSKLHTQLFQGSPAKVNIKIEDELGAYSWDNKTLTVKPLPIENKPAKEVMQIVDNLYKSDTVDDNNLDELVKNKDSPAALVKVASILTAVPVLKKLKDEEGMEEYNDNFFKKIIDTLAVLPVHNHESACQMLSSSLLVVKSDDELSHHNAYGISKVMKNVMSNLNKHHLSDGKTQEELLAVSNTFLDLSSQLVKEQPIESYLNATTTTPAPRNVDYALKEDYPNYIGIDSDAMDRLDDLEKTTDAVLESMNTLGNYISTSLGRGGKPVTIKKDGVFYFIQVEEPNKLVNRMYSDESAGATGSSLFINQNMERDIMSAGRTISLQVSILTTNPFWWHPKTPKLDSEVMIVNMNTRTKVKGRGFRRPQSLNSKVFENPFDIYVKIDPKNTSIINGSVTVPEDLINMEDSELPQDVMAVHQFDATKGASLYVKFTTLSHAIKVIIRLDQRPTTEDFVTQHPTRIINDGSFDESKVIKAGDGSAVEGSRYYLAVLPLQEVKTRRAMESLTANYTFEVYSAECRYWNAPNAEWITDKCQMGPNTNISMMHCRCYHLSLFGGEFYVPPNRIDFQHTINLFLSINENLVVLIVLLVIYIIFIILFLWSFAMDKNDVAKKYAIYLENNTPEEEYCYLIMVFTGSRPHAGTTANVVIQIEGDKDITRPRVLSHSKLKMMERSADNWFILTTTKTLGEIHTIKLWHDNSGRHPSWYCKRVYIRDLETERAWTFLPRRWLSLKRGSGEINCTLHPATNEELATFTVAFDDLITYNMQNSHAWLAIGTKHPRTGYLRIQRVTCAWCVILSGMLVSMMFYGVPSTNIANQAEDGEFTINVRFFIISIESLLITLPINTLIVLLFTRSRPKQTGEVIEEDPNEDPVHRQLKTRIDRMTIHLHKPYIFPYYGVYIGWALAIFLILICSIFILLYGLTFGRVRSLLWLSSIMLGLLQNMFLINPACIIVLAIVIAFITRRGPMLPGATVLLPTEEEKISNEYYRAYCDSLIFKMTLEKPLTEEQTKLLKRRHELRQKSAEILKDFLMFTLYLSALYWLFFVIIDPMKYYCNQNAMNLVVGRTYNSGFPFDEVHSDEMLVEYLNNTLLPILFSEDWYPGVNMTGYGWLPDYTNKLLGIPRLRQLRVRGNSCVVAPEFTNLIMNCHEDLSYMDVRSYNPLWKPVTQSRWRDETSKVSSPWLFQTDVDSNTRVVMGEIQIYPGGGYIADLGRSVENSRKILDFLITNNWIDVQTRVVFVDFSMYDTNLNLFNIITLIGERSGIGTYVPSVEVKTERFHINWDHISLSMKMSFFIFGIFTIVYIYYFIRGAYRSGLKEYFRDVWNIIDFIIIICSILCIVFLIIRSYIIEILIQKLDGSKKNEFVSFILAAYWEQMINYVLGILCCLATARLWKLLRFYRTFKLMESTLLIANRTLLWTSLLMLFIVWIFSILCHIIFGSYMLDFSNIHNSMTTLVSMAIRINKDFAHAKMNSEDECLRNLIYFFFICTIRLLMLYLFISIVRHYFQMAKIQDKYYKGERYKLGDYVKTEVEVFVGYYSKRMKQVRKTRKKMKKILKKIKKQIRKEEEEEKMRLRAGADPRRWMEKGKHTAVPKPPAIKYKNSTNCRQYKINLMKLMVTDYYLSDEKITPSKQMSSMTYVAGYVIRDGKDIYNFFRETDDSSLVTEEQLDIMELYVNYITRHLHHGRLLSNSLLPDEDLEIPTEYEYLDLDNVKFISAQLDYAYVLLDYMLLNDEVFDADLFDEVERKISISPTEITPKEVSPTPSIIERFETLKDVHPTCHKQKHISINKQSSHLCKSHQKLHHKCRRIEYIDKKLSPSEKYDINKKMPCCASVSPTKHYLNLQYPELMDIMYVNDNLPMTESTSSVSSVDRTTSVHFTTCASMQTEAQHEIEYNNTGVQTRETASIGTDSPVTDTVEFHRETRVKHKINTRTVSTQYYDNADQIVCKYSYVKNCPHQARTNKKECTAINKESKAIKKKNRIDKSISKLSKLSSYDAYDYGAKAKCSYQNSQGLIQNDCSSMVPKQDFQKVFQKKTKDSNLSNQQYVHVLRPVEFDVPQKCKCVDPSTDATTQLPDPIKSRCSCVKSLIVPSTSKNGQVVIDINQYKNLCDDDKLEYAQQRTLRPADDISRIDGAVQSDLMANHEKSQCKQKDCKGGGGPGGSVQRQ